MMLGFKPGLYFRTCWLFLSPATLLVTEPGREGCWLGSGLRGWVGTRILVPSPPPWYLQLL